MWVTPMRAAKGTTRSASRAVRASIVQAMTKKLRANPIISESQPAYMLWS
jgi:hypothetical protein